MEMLDQAVRAVHAIWTQVCIALAASGSLTDWIQAVGTAGALPLTVWFALRRDASERRKEAKTQAAQVKAGDEQAQNKIFVRDVTLVTQFLYCGLRLKWMGEDLRACKNAGDVLASIESLQQLVEILDHYIDVLQKLNAKDLPIGRGKIPMTAPVDQMIVILISLKVSLSAYALESFAAEEDLDRRIENTVSLGVWLQDYAEDVFDWLKVLLPVVGPRAQEWVEQHRRNLEDALGKDNLPTLPVEVLTVVARAHQPPSATAAGPARPPFLEAR